MRYFIPDGFDRPEGDRGKKKIRELIEILFFLNLQKLLWKLSTSRYSDDKSLMVSV